MMFMFVSFELMNVTIVLYKPELSRTPTTCSYSPLGAGNSTQVL